MSNMLSFRELALVVLTAVLAAVACFVVANSLGDWPPYRATSTLIIDETPDGESSGVSAEGITIAQNTMAALIRREPLSSQVAADLDIGLDGEGLVDRLRIDVPENAPIVEVSATAGDGETAVRIADAVVMAAADLDSPLTGASVLSLADPPQRPVLSSYLIVAAAAITGGFLGLGGVFARRFQTDTVRTIDDVRASSDLPVIGHVRLSERGGDQRLKDRVLLASLGNRMRQDNLDLLFTSPTELPAMDSLIDMQRSVLGPLRVPADQNGEVSVEELLAEIPTPISTEARTSLDLEDLLAKQESVTTELEAGIGAVSPDLRVDAIEAGEGDETDDADDEPTVTVESRKLRPTFTADELIEADRKGVRLTDGDVSIVEAPPLLTDFSFLDQLSSSTSLVILAEVKVTRKADLRAASDAVQQAGRVRPGVLLIG